MEYKILKPAVNEGIAVLTISRPAALNALNSSFFTEMEDYLTNLSKMKEVRVLIITGDGEKSFVAGADIAEMVNMNPEQAMKFSQTGQKVFAMIEELDIPVIAAVNGFALGGGCELAMACDFRIAGSNAKFGQPEVNLGLIPGYAGTQRLSRLAGPADALYMICTAEMLTADDALRIGLVQRVTEPAKLMETVMELAKKIITKGPESVKKSKKLIRDGFKMNFRDACEMESKVFSGLFGTPEATEGMKAFLEKRKANFN
jgi:enoyl-CoA hydratase